MFVSHFFTWQNFILVVLDRFLFHLGDKKVVAGCPRQVVVSYSNDCMRVYLGGFSIDCLRLVVVSERWSFEQVWPYIIKNIYKLKKNWQKRKLCFYIPVILIDSVYRKDENYYFKFFFEEFIHNFFWRSIRNFGFWDFGSLKI